MKAKKNELDVDIIGLQGGLTKEEEEALSLFFKMRKVNLKAKTSTLKSKARKRTKSVA